jgi:hypothetical protein
MINTKPLSLKERRNEHKKKKAHLNDSGNSLQAHKIFIKSLEEPRPATTEPTSPQSETAVQK